MQHTMRIISVRVMPVGQVFAWIYGCIGVYQGFVFALSGSERVAFPLGIVFPLFHFNINWIVARPVSPAVAVFLVLVMVISYAITGGITGAFLTLCFNFVLHIRGGINAAFVHLKEETAPTEQRVTSALGHIRVPDRTLI